MTEMNWFDLSKDGFKLTAYKHKDGHFLFVLTQTGNVSEEIINKLKSQNFQSFSGGYAAPMTPERAQVLANFPNAQKIDVSPESVIVENKGAKNENVSTNNPGTASRKRSGTSSKTTKSGRAKKFLRNKIRNDRKRNQSNQESNIEKQSDSKRRKVSGDHTAHELDQQHSKTHGVERESPNDNLRVLNSSHYFISDEINRSGSFSTQERYKENIDAIKILKELEEIGRPATQEEKSKLVKYNGWGGMAKVFDSYYAGPQKAQWMRDAKKEISDLLTRQEIDSASQSTPNSFYTSPEVIKAIWDAIYKTGFTGGNVLEPSLGVGSFFGLVDPEVAKKSRFVGVELESLAGRIAQKIYPDAKIYIDGFEKVSLPDNYFDVVTTNVPFGNYKVYDPEYKKDKFSIHDYFLVKSLDKAKPDGIVAVITSSFSMDKKTNRARKRLAEKGDLLTAIRLPSDSQQSQAGTDVTEDILFFRKKDKEKYLTEEEYPDWVFSKEIEVKDKRHEPYHHVLPVNKYFIENDQNILGTLKADLGFNGGARIVVQNESEKNLTTLLSEFIEKEFSGYEIDNIQADGDLPDVDLSENEDFFDDQYPDGFNEIYVGSLFTDIENGETAIYQKISPQKFEKIDLQGKKRERLLGLLNLRDILNNVLARQKESTEDTYEYINARKNLNEAYDAFIKKHGYVNKPVNANLMQDDPAFGRLMGLEKYDLQNDTAEKADIFTTRVIKTPEPITSTDNIYEALLVSLNQKGRIDLETIASLCDKNYETAKQELVESREIFKNPASMQWEHKSQYLSGNIRKKISQAEKMLPFDSNFQVNIDELNKVKPEDLQPKDIDAKLGAPWIDEEDIKDFICACLEIGFIDKDDIYVKQYQTDGTWKVHVPRHIRGRIQSKSDWGTMRVPFPDLIEGALNQRRPKVFDTEYDEEGNKVRVFNFKETVAAEEKLDAIQQCFRRFIWEDDVERAEKLLFRYNYMFNTFVPPKFTGDHMTFPGMSLNYKPRPYQASAIWRCLNGNTLLGHEVGTGKTLIQIASAIEMRRLGLAHKPLMVVPNSMLEQINREARQIYPNAEILMVTNSDLQKQNRKKFVGKVINNNWDLVVVTHSMFTKIQNDPIFEKNILQDELFNYKAELDSFSNNEKRYSRKQIEKKIKTVEARLERLSDSKKDDAVYIDDLGIDSIILDEAHNFKNLSVQASNPEISSAINGSQRAWDLYIKTQWLNKKRADNKGVIFASGTPVTNNPLEIYNMQRYLQPEILEESNIEFASNWAANFLEQKTNWEPSATGNDWKKKTRFILNNVPELMQLFRNTLDIVTAQDAGIKLPEVEKKNIVSPISDLQQQLMKSLDDDLKKGAHVFSVMHKGKHIALDPQTISEDFEDDHLESKLSLLTETVFEEWDGSHDINGTQLIFCDLSTPKNGKQYSVYDTVKEKLIEKGIDENEIAFIHDYNTDSKKASLFSKVRNGEIRVLMGSTEKMGEGLNVQDKLVALHHLDAPWTPAKVQQRNGRMVRFGNENDNAKIYIYTTKDTFDLFKWNLLKIKEDQFAQVLKGDGNIRRFDLEIDPTYYETAAITSGNPHIKEKLEVDHEIVKLESLAKSHSDQIYNMKVKLQYQQKQENEIQKQLNLFKSVPDPVESPEVWRFAATKYGFDEDLETNREKFLPVLKKIIDSQQLTKISDIQCGGLPVTFSRSFNAEHGKFQTEWFIHTDAGDIYRSGAKRIEDFIANKKEHIMHNELKLKDVHNQIEQLQKKINEPFTHEEELKNLYAKQRELNDKIDKNSSTEPEDEQDSSASVEELDGCGQNEKGFHINNESESLVGVSP